jgi:hypothetical protein
MKRPTHTWCATAALSVLVATAAFAHGADGVHLLGVVTAVDAASLSIETKDGEPVSVRLDEKTQFERSGSRATASDLRPGERVVVHAKKEAGGLKAQLVKFGKKPKQGASRSDADAGTRGAPSSRDEKGGEAERSTLTSATRARVGGNRRVALHDTERYP